jgi:Uma2 family endonuclease
MSIVTEPGGSGPIPPFPVYQISVQKYHEMIRKGVLTEDDPVELLEGWLVPKMPRTPPHDAAITLTDDALRGILPPGWHTRIQCAITTQDSEPEPDIAVVEGDRRAFATHHPEPSQIGLLIESAESSVDTDRVDKGRIYARANIPFYWILNLVDRHIEVYCDPDPQAMPPRYRQSQVYRPGQMIALVLKGQSAGQVRVDDLLPDL